MCPVFRRHDSVLFFFLVHDSSLDLCMGDANETYSATGTAHSSEALSFWCSCWQIFSFLCIVCGQLSLFWTLCCLSFGLWLLITPCISSQFSWIMSAITIIFGFLTVLQTKYIHDYQMIFHVQCPFNWLCTLFGLL